MVGGGWGGTGMGTTHSIPLSCLSKRTTGAACPASATWLQKCQRAASQLFVSPKENRQAFSLVPVSFSRTHWAVLELTEAYSNGQALSSLPQPTHQAYAGEGHPHTPLSPSANKRDAPREGFGGSRDQLWRHRNSEFYFPTYLACNAKPSPSSLLQLPVSSCRITQIGATAPL